MENTNPITVDGETLEQLEIFMYLGSITDKQGGSDVNVKAKIGKEKTTNVTAASAAVSLNIHKRKNKILRYSTTCNNQITIEGEALDNVKTSTYLGSIIDEHSGFDADVKVWIGKARAAYLQLKNI
ncbi:unnamed protein product [Schistosoma margrebowiei]|uniref:Uncharacterized protein n=1 Tax=Schistosoma margrebowiei TaxID=48269 RepID=A0A183MHF9_9TREM|nr:unnamed protein product [Schistosoma margrebowiei]